MKHHPTTSDNPNAKLINEVINIAFKSNINT